MSNVTALKRHDAPTMTAIQKLAQQFDLDPVEFELTVKKTVCPANITNEQFKAFIMVAAEYHLNPITKQIYAFPAKSGGIVPVVSIDGWIRIINEHPDFDGMEFSDHMEGGRLVSITCRMYRKGRSRPTEVTEYMVECVRGTDTWRQWPARMLRHKATIQAARYAFGLTGIYDPDEAERIGVKDVDPETGEIKEPAPETTRTDAAKEVLKKGNKKADAPAGATIEGEAREVKSDEAQDPFEEAREQIAQAESVTGLVELMNGFDQETRRAVNSVFKTRLANLKAGGQA